MSRIRENISRERELIVKMHQVEYWCFAVNWTYTHPIKVYAIKLSQV